MPWQTEINKESKQRNTRNASADNESPESREGAVLLQEADIIMQPIWKSQRAPRLWQAYAQTRHSPPWAATSTARACISSAHLPERTSARTPQYIRATCQHTRVCKRAPPRTLFCR